MGSKNNKQDYDYVKQRVYDMYQGEYEIITPKENYINIHAKIMIKHNGIRCGGHICETTLKSFFKGSKCVVCTTNRNNDYSFRNKVKELVKDEYEVLSKYENGDSYVDIRHNCDRCGNHIYKVRPKKFLEGKRCPACNRPNYNTDDVGRKKRFNKERPNETFEYISYNNENIKIKVEHSCKDGRKYKFDIYSKDVQTMECPRCGNKKVKYRDDILFKEELQNISNGDIVCIDKFINLSTKIRFKHIGNSCNYIWETKPSVLLRGSGCPCCNESKGEKAIKEVLRKYNINFKREYVFEGLVSEKGNYLRFDFAIMDRENNLKFLVEFDGEFHYKYIESWGNDLEYQQMNDKKKEIFCKENNIELIRIPYWEKKNIENILRNKLSEINEFKEVI